MTPVQIIIIINVTIQNHISGRRGVVSIQEGLHCSISTGGLQGEVVSAGQTSSPVP